MGWKNLLQSGFDGYKPLIWLGILSLLGCMDAGDKPLRIAAASSMRPLLEALAQDFQTETGQEVDFIWGSSGALTSQIEQGAPYDLFFVADPAYSQRLEQALPLPQAPQDFCQGKLALVLGRLDYRLDFPSSATELVPDADRVQHLSLASPKVAPYGAAAESWLSLQNPSWQKRKVYATSASGVVAHVQQGAAEIGITAASLALHHFPAAQVQILNGSIVLAPPASVLETPELPKAKLALPLHQLVQLSSNQKVFSFLEFLEQHADTEFLEAYGFSALP